MSMESQDDKIARLERELAEKDDYIQKLKNENDSLNIKVAKKICEKEEYKKRCKELERKLEVKEHFEKQENIDMVMIRASKQGIKIAELEAEIQKLKCEHKKASVQGHNVRGAGRKPKLNDKKDEIKQLRAEGMKIAELAVKYNCSVGKIHKLISE